MATIEEKVQCVLWFHEKNPRINVQRKFRRCYGRKPPAVKSVKQWYELFKEIDSVKVLPGSGKFSVSEATFEHFWELFQRSSIKTTLEGLR
ncbi:DUF4817 domain-containing protein [Trichonephila clavipes]|nr:DUF4817 domain-containing protein [Trichonephila clavipes]